MDWQVALNDPEALRAQGLFIAEGRLVLERLLGGAAGGPGAIVSVLATPPAARALRLDEHLPDRLTLRTPSEMELLTGFNFHRGVLALVRRPAPLTVEEVVGARAPEPLVRSSVFVVAEQLVDVDNVGSCFRNARGFGASGVLLDERCPDPLYRKAVRTSLGYVLEMPWAAAPIGDIVQKLARAGVTSIGLTPRGGPRGGTPETLAAVAARLDRQSPLALVIGNEGHGLTAATMAACHELACIPMAEGADSLNVATALAVALYELTR